MKKSCPKNFEFVTEKTLKNLRSEAEFRLARQHFIRTILQNNPGAVVVTGHHQNDLLETYFLKLIRGSGSQGFKNFKAFDWPHMDAFKHEGDKLHGDIAYCFLPWD